MTKDQCLRLIRYFADELDTAPRQGHGNVDDPEGTLTVRMSSTWAKDHATTLRSLADDLERS